MMLVRMLQNQTSPSLLSSQELPTPDVSLSCSNISTKCSLSFSSVCFVISAGALPLNILVLWAIWPQVRSPFGLSVYVVSLLLAAILESIILPFGAAYGFGILTLASFGFYITFAIPDLTQRLATILIVWMFILRYLAVAHPLSYRKFCTGWKCGITTLSFWTIAIVLSIAEYIFRKYDENLCFPDYKVGQETAVMHLLFSFFFGLLPFLILATLGTLIYCVLKRSPSVPNAQRTRISNLLLLVVLGFGLLFGPMNGIQGYQSILLLYGKSPCELKLYLLLPYQLTFTLNCFGLIMAPLFYIYSCSRVKERLKVLFTKYKGTKTNPEQCPNRTTD